MEITTCNWCGTKVIPNQENGCPSCGRLVTDKRPQPIVAEPVVTELRIFTPAVPPPPTSAETLSKFAFIPAAGIWITEVLMRAVLTIPNGKDFSGFGLVPILALGLMVGTGSLVAYVALLISTMAALRRGHFSDKGDVWINVIPGLVITLVVIFFVRGFVCPATLWFFAR